MTTNESPTNTRAGSMEASGVGSSPYIVGSTYMYQGTLWHSRHLFTPEHKSDLAWMESYFNAGGSWALMEPCECGKSKPINEWCECPKGETGREEFYNVQRRKHTLNGGLSDGQAK
jgi:hypothetical protein